MENFKRFTGALLILVVLFAGVQSCNTDMSQRAESPVGTIGDTGAARFLPAPAFAQTGGDMSIADIVEKNIDSVVNVSSVRVVRYEGSPFLNDPFFRHFFGDEFQNRTPRSERREQSLGSGVIVSEDGLILTNNHVIAEASELRVILHDNREFEAEVVGADPQSDLAVIRLKEDNVEGLKPMAFGDSDVLRLGDVVLAIGNPFGLNHTVTMGIVSAKGRSFAAAGRIAEYEDFIQTDAAINPGNSGGALINLKGELIGINTAIASRTGGYQGIGFAIPANMAQLIMTGLVEEGKIVRGWLGVGLQDVSYDIAETLGMDTPKGAMIAEVFKDTPAENAGLKAGDIILGVDNKEIESINQLRNIIALIGANENTTLTVLRDGKQMDVRVKLTERTDDMDMAAVTGEGEESIDGLRIAELDRTNRAQYEIPADIDYGIVVIGVSEESVAANIDIREGDVIREINNKEVESADQFIREYKNSNGNVLLYVYRGGRHFFRVLKN